MRKIIAILILFVFLPFSTFSQEKEKPQKNMVSLDTVFSKNFILKHLSFNKGLDNKGRGETLEVSFQLYNQIDIGMDLYVFVIATFEVDRKKVSSFHNPRPQREIIRYFVPFPEGNKNFEYASNENTKKTTFKKFPKDPKAGINPLTGKTYRLGRDSLLIRTKHLCKYRKEYDYFNKVTVLIFEKISEGKKKGAIEPVFRRVYQFVGKRQ